MNDWRTACVGPAMSVAEVIGRIDRTALQIALVVDANCELLGTVTDGDIRRAILRGVGLADEVAGIMNKTPTFVLPDQPRSAILTLMRSKGMRHMPLVDHAGCVVGLEVIEDLLGTPERDNVVVLMVGGLGSRLAPLTEECPKPMLQVGCRPVLETILLNFIEHGFRRFLLAVNHKADMIIDHFGDGSAWNVHIHYLKESRQLGTAGAIAMMRDRPDDTFLVMNGDILTKVNLAYLLEFHRQQRVSATMCIREYFYQVPYGVVKLNGQQISAIEEKPLQKYFVSAGIYALEPDVIDLIPKGQCFDMTMLFDRLVETGTKTAAFPVLEYWLDIGQPSDLARAQDEFQRTFDVGRTASA